MIGKPKRFVGGSGFAECPRIRASSSFPQAPPGYFQRSINAKKQSEKPGFPIS